MAHVFAYTSAYRQIREGGANLFKFKWTFACFKGARQYILGLKNRLKSKLPQSLLLTEMLVVKLTFGQKCLLGPGYSYRGAFLSVEKKYPKILSV